MHAPALIELHCHADGLIDPPMLRELARRGVPCPAEADALAEVVPVRSFGQWMEQYGPRVAPCMASTSQLISILEIHIERLVEQGVRYAELMLSGLLQPSGDLGRVLDTFSAIRAAVDRVRADQLEIGLLVAIGRGSPERAKRQIDRVLEIAKLGLIRGLAIAGDETACTIESLSHQCSRIRDAGLGLEIHAGEMAGPESVWDALEHGRPDRIGHGIRAFEDPKLVEVLVERQIHLEFCVTSNLRLGFCRSVTDHPIARARALGIPFSFNTDDPGPFGCSMRSERALLENTLGFAEADFARIADDALKASFRR
jgi:adenosine deaminase